MGRLVVVHLDYPFVVLLGRQRLWQPLCSLLICNGCDNSHEPYNNGYDKRMPLTVRATAAGFAPLPVSPETTTRIPQEDGLVTRFTAGDAIGLFAIKDKAIADLLRQSA